MYWLDRGLKMKRILWLLLLITALMTTPTYAAVIRSEICLGGMSKALNDFYDRGGQLYDPDDLRVLSAVMQLENGSNSDECLLLTGSVLLNRKEYCEWAPDTLRECVLQGYGTKFQQYATKTVTELDKVKVTNRVRKLAVQLLLFGQVCPPDIIYQSMNKELGSVWKVIDGEYFAKEKSKSDKSGNGKKK